ncbi:MAG TPA: glycosyltransferase family 1 protein, partial [Hydrogenophaga sp.]|nr:glycosyltransferase family 1 protein [Hydrogenophaga sp.]
RQAARLAREPALVRAAATQARAQVVALDWQHIAAQVEGIFLQTVGWPHAMPEGWSPSMAV